MSTRIRILFHTGMEGNRAHLGRRAIAAMQKYIQREEKEEPPIPYTAWTSFHVNQFLYTTSKEQMQSVPVRRRDKGPRMKPPSREALAELPLPSRAKALWKQLPEGIRMVSHLFVVREARSMNWRKSLANPARYGWTVQHAPTTPAPGLPASEAQSPFATDGLQGLQQELQGLQPWTESSGTKLTSGTAKKPSPSGQSGKKTVGYKLVVGGTSPAPVEEKPAKPKLKVGIWQ